MRISQVDPRMTKSDHFRTALLQAAPASYKPRSRNRRDQLTDESAEPAPLTEVPEPVSPEANESPTSPSTIGSTEEEHDGSQPNATEPPEEATPAATIAAPMPWSRSDMLPLLPPPLGGGTGQATPVASFWILAWWLHTVFRHRYFGDSECEDCGLPSVTRAALSCVLCVWAASARWACSCCQ